MERAGIDYYLVATLDEDLLAELLARGVPAFGLGRQSPTKDMPFGSAEFNAMVRKGVEIVLDVRRVRKSPGKWYIGSTRWSGFGCFKFYVVLMRMWMYSRACHCIEVNGYWVWKPHGLVVVEVNMLL